VTPENGKHQAKQPLFLSILALATQVPDFGAVAVMGEYSNFVHSQKNIKFRPFARIPR
jgi:hypothetical protein